MVVLLFGETVTMSILKYTMSLLVLNFLSFVRQMNVANVLVLDLTVMVNVMVLSKIVQVCVEEQQNLMNVAYVMVVILLVQIVVVKYMVMEPLVIRILFGMMVAIVVQCLVALHVMLQENNVIVMVLCGIVLVNV